MSSPKPIIKFGLLWSSVELRPAMPHPQPNNHLCSLAFTCLVACFLSHHWQHPFPRKPCSRTRLLGSSLRRNLISVREREREIAARESQALGRSHQLPFNSPGFPRVNSGPFLKQTTLNTNPTNNIPAHYLTLACIPVDPLTNLLINPN